MSMSISFCPHKEHQNILIMFIYIIYENKHHQVRSYANDKIAAASDKVYQLLAQSRSFSPASSTTKTGRHDIAEILLKVALNTKNQIKPNDEKAARFFGDGVNIYNGNP